MITFIGMGERSSGQIRGQQITRHLGGNFIDKMNLSRDSAFFSHTIMIRSPMPAGVIRALQKEGAKVGLDILDVPASNFLCHGQEFENMRSYIFEDIFDFYIVNNSEIKRLVEEVSQTPCFVIPHHTVNFSSQRTCFGDKIKRIGYLGLIDQIDRIEDLQAVADDLDMELVSANEETVEGCTNFLSTLDAGVIFLEEDCPKDETIEFLVGGKSRDVNKQKRAEHLKRFKPNTKLSNFQSFGIPTVCTEYESFKEFGGHHYIPIRSIDEVQKALENLKKDNSLRQGLSNSSYEHAQSLHIGNVSNFYREILKK
tara:strand:+ start:1778 stop:2713 length:936 start_codon:yes stop_codon:yes gene_type:complete